MRPLAVCAALAALVSSAGSAELPVPEPGVDFGSLCEAYGPGFKSVGGSEICLKVSGSVAAEPGFVAGDDRVGRREANSWKSRAEGEVEVESRFETDFGTVRTFFAIEAPEDDR